MVAADYVLGVQGFEGFTPPFLYLVRQSGLCCREIKKDHTQPKETVMAALNPQPLPPLEHPIQVHAPAEILFDLEAFQRVQASVLAKAGHPGCTSGMQFLWQAYEEFAVDPSGEVQPVLPGTTSVQDD